MRVSIEDVQWIHGAANCALNSDPPIQIHELDEATFIMRVSKCFSYEGNFLYLLFGNKRAILFDTGGPPDRQNVDTVLPVRSTVDKIVHVICNPAASMVLISSLPTRTVTLIMHSGMVNSLGGRGRSSSSRHCRRSRVFINCQIGRRVKRFSTWEQGS